MHNTAPQRGIPARWPYVEIQLAIRRRKGTKGVRRVRGLCAVDLESLRYRYSRSDGARILWLDRETFSVILSRRGKIKGPAARRVDRTHSSRRARFSPRNYFKKSLKKWEHRERTRNTRCIRERERERERETAFVARVENKIETGVLLEGTFEQFRETSSQTSDP